MLIDKTEPGTRFTHRQTLGLIVLSAALFMGGMDSTLLNVALPELSRVLSANPAETVWIVNSYTLTVAATIVTLTDVGSRFGQKRTFLVGLAGFAVASLAAAFGRSPVEIIILRCVQGVFAAALMATAVPLLSAIFAGSARRRLAISIWTASASLGAALGPVIGGILLEQFWWGANFLVNVPIAVAAAVVGWIYLADTPRVARQVDLPSLTCSILGIGGIAYALQSLTEPDLRNAFGIAAIPVSVLAVVIFIRRQLTSRMPILQLRLFRNSIFTTATVAIMLSWGLYAAAIFSITQYQQLGLERTPLIAGLLIVPLAIANTLGAVTTSRLLAKFRPTTALATSLVIGAIGFLLLAGLGLNTGLWAIAVVGISTGIATASGTTLMVESVGVTAQSDAGAIQETAFSLGSGFGVATIGMSISLISNQISNRYETTVVRELATRYSYLLPAIALLAISFAVQMSARGHQPVVDAHKQDEEIEI
ncbi:MFS transporter [Nocardia sp. NPDC051321]|uniref:MFS transporter n=1 Tax=Nocardia sp. NPDC051321 TaxID=3364323 RepID=UPI0037AA0EB7